MLKLLLIVAALREAEVQYCSPGSFQSLCNSVLLVYANVPSYGEDVQAKLRSTGTFTTVDTFNVMPGTPTAEQLACYDAVLVFSANAILDAVTLGDRLAAYHGEGGGVVVAPLANCDDYL